MRITFLLFLSFLYMPAATASDAQELHRLHAALDGGEVPSQIEVLREPAEEDWRSRVIVRIGEARYVAGYFSADADLPDIRVVAIDRSRPQRQLLLHTPEPGTCIFHLLGYIGTELVPLLRFDSGPGCRAPPPAAWQWLCQRLHLGRLLGQGGPLPADRGWRGAPA